MFNASFDEDNCVIEGGRRLLSKCKHALDINCVSALMTTIAETNIPAVVTCWKLTKEELEEVNRTGRVWVTVIGRSMQPLSVDGFKPIGKDGA